MVRVETTRPGRRVVVDAEGIEPGGLRLDVRQYLAPVTYRLHVGVVIKIQANLLGVAAYGTAGHDGLRQVERPALAQGRVVGAGLGRRGELALLGALHAEAGEAHRLRHCCRVRVGV